MKRGAKRRFTGLWVYVMIYQCEFLENEALALVELKNKIVLRQWARTEEEWELITGQLYFKNACVRHVIDTARGVKSTVVTPRKLLVKKGTSSQS